MAREITDQDRRKAITQRKETALALRKRAVEAVKARGGIAHLEKRLGVNASSAQKPMPRTEPLSDAEKNRRALELQCQKYKLTLPTFAPTDGQLAELKKKAFEIAERLKAGKP